MARTALQGGTKHLLSFASKYCSPVTATQMVLDAAKRLEKFTAPYKRYNWEIEIAEKGADYTRSAVN